MSYKGKTVVITGGAGTIGTALAWAFAEKGAGIALVDLDAVTLESRAAGLRQKGVPVTCHAGDISSRGQCERIIREVIDHWKRLDILVNNAGITHLGTFLETDVSVIERVIAVNFFGSVYCTKAALPHILAVRGAVITMESIAGITPLPLRTGYCASKHALHGFAATLRMELKRSGVHVMHVCPGFIRSGLQQAALGPDGRPASAPRVIVGREYSPDLVARAVLKGLKRKKHTLVLTTIGWLGVLLHRLLPCLFEKILERKIMGYHP